MFDFMDGGFDDAASFDSSGPYIPEASDCMRCGMCVNVCPTFQLFHIEEETPRRRIRTISKILIDKQAISAEEQEHLQNCVQCRACEVVCPSRMAYAALFDEAQRELVCNSTWLGKIALRLVEHKRSRSCLMPLLWLYVKSGLQQPMRRSGLLAKLGVANAEALLAKPALQSLAATYPPAVKLRGQVALFTGCIAEHFDQPVLLAAIRLLNAIGFEVWVPPQQGCCGAIHQHNGLDAQPFVDKNMEVFNALEVDAVLHTASGCGAMLSEYQQDDTAGQLFSQRLVDINDFLLSHWPDDMPLHSKHLRVAVHEPCSQRSVLKNQQSVYALLEKIPGISLQPLADNALCCGAGGSYMLTHPENAEQLRVSKRETIAAAQADRVVSSNFGCAVFLNAQPGQIVHPVVLLTECLEDR